MNKKGFIGVAVLWMVAAMSAIALSALASAKGRQARGRAAVQEARSIWLAREGALLAVESNFEFSERTHEFEQGKVRVERRIAAAELTRLVCAVECGPSKRMVETGWKRSGGTWRAVYWKEPA